MTAGLNHQLQSDIFPLTIPLSPDWEKGWKPYPLFRGWTVGLPFFSCHASVLTPGSCPHPVHTHKEEELLLMLSGEADLTLPELDTDNENHKTHLKPGQFFYYPSHFPHTLRATGSEPANYVMFKWQHSKIGTRLPLSYQWFSIRQALNDPCETGFHHRLVFEGPTVYLKKLQCHTSTLTPGAGYPPHKDPYDVAIIVLKGEVETLGRRAGPNSVIFYPTGEPHGMRNPGQETARYIVFEFHRRWHSSGLTAITDLQRWKYEFNHLFNHLCKKIRDRRL